MHLCVCACTRAPRERERERERERQRETERGKQSELKDNERERLWTMNPTAEAKEWCSAPTDIVWGVQRSPPDVHLLFELISSGGMGRKSGHYTLLVEANAAEKAFMRVPKSVQHFAEGSASSMPLLKVHMEYLELLLSGEKQWELRSTPVNRRGRVALGIGGMAYGSAVLRDSVLVGVKARGSAWTPPEGGNHNFWLSAQNMNKHRVSEDKVESLMMGRDDQKLWAWVFTDAIRFDRPIPYKIDGSVRWTTLKAWIQGTCSIYTRFLLAR